MEIMLVSSELGGDGTFEKVVKKLGHGLESFRTGADALEISDKKPIDLILMDASFPEMEGYALTTAGLFTG